MAGLNEDELQIVSHYMAPDYVLAAANEHGEGDFVRGAPDAYREVRNAVRRYIRTIRSDRGADIKLALLLRNLGWIPWGFDHVKPLWSRELELYGRLYPDVTPIPGWVEVDVGDKPHDFVFRATMRVVSAMLERDELNKCVLHGKPYQRTDQRVMIHLKTREGLRSPVFDAAGMTDEKLKLKIRRALRAAVKAEAHEPQITLAGRQLLYAWLKVGFITSPAGAMVSSAPKVPAGYAALVPTNGVSLAVSVNRVKDSKCIITLTPDHRVYSGDDAGEMYEYIEREVQNACIDHRGQ